MKKKTKKRCIKTRKFHNDNASHVDQINDDIVEQLQRQRLKKSSKLELEANNDNDIDSSNADDSTLKRQHLNVESTTVDTCPNLYIVHGKYTYDIVRGAYYPTKDVQMNKRKTTGTSNNSNSGSSNANDSYLIDKKKYIIRPPIMSYKTQLLHGGTKRRRNMICDWYGKMIHDSMHIEYTTNYKTIIGLNPYLDDLNQDDGYMHLVQSSSSPLWSRTFDVINVNTNTLIFSLQNKYFNDHWKRVSLFPHRQEQQQQSRLSIGCLRQFDIVSGTDLLLFDNDGVIHNRYNIPFEVNDFTILPYNTNHQSNHIYCGGNNYRRCMIDVSDLIGLRHAKTFNNNNNNDNNMKSDILCIETDSSPSHNRPELLFVGCRNGHIYVYDTRVDMDKVIGMMSIKNNSKNSTTTNGCNLHNSVSKTNTAIENILRIQPLFQERPNQLLVRGNNSWCTFDIRNLNSYNNNNNDTSQMNRMKSDALVQKVPFMTESDYHSSTLCCPGKGMATDPLQSTIMIPFHWNKDDSYNSYGVKLWSLETGHYLGSKMIQPNNHHDYNSVDTTTTLLTTTAATAPTQLQSVYIHCSEVEICSTITPAIHLTDDTDNNDNNKNINGKDIDYPASKFKSGSFGLWLKLGHLGMYHITCDGRYMSP